MLGAIAVAETDLDRTGLILIGNEAWRAIALEKIARGSTVRVVAIDGVLLKVEPIHSLEKTC